MPADLFAHRLSSLRPGSLVKESVEEGDLAQRRFQNDLHLKGTLESIYEKYSKDFEEVGDVVNILTSEVIVNRGHVVRMKNELDVGTGETSTPHTSWINALVDEESEIEELRSDEDELCVRSSKPVKLPGVSRSLEKINTAAESQDRLRHGKRLSSSSVVSPTPAHHPLAEERTPVAGSGSHITVPGEPPRLDAAIETFTASITQQWHALVNSYFPTQTASNAQPHVQAIAPVQIPAFYTPPVRSKIGRPQLSKRRYSDISGQPEPALSRSISASRQSLTSESTGDGKRLRLRSPPETPSLWATGSGKGRRLPGYHPKTTPQSRRVPRQPSPRISSILSLLEDEEDELAAEGEKVDLERRKHGIRRNPSTPNGQINVLNNTASETPLETAKLSGEDTFDFEHDQDPLLGWNGEEEMDELDLIGVPDVSPSGAATQPVDIPTSSTKTQRRLQESQGSTSRKGKSSAILTNQHHAPSQRSGSEDLDFSSPQRSSRVQMRGDTIQGKSTTQSAPQADLHASSPNRDNNQRARKTLSAKQDGRPIVDIRMAGKTEVLPPIARVSSRPLCKTPAAKGSAATSTPESRVASYVRFSSGVPRQRKKRRMLLLQP
ncbi:hypothetical protein EJ08DRAFT_100419 [Tothia fuscella]|uniref:Uncharacterized protein n=1 Tax=Tothia fuscella TaxID=1048955 RepID=A0A9P4TZU6_9PEZI|nr:hypothetical protein EJ08DRAFT_100419 [Tothia fuscella]